MLWAQMQKQKSSVEVGGGRSMIFSRRQAVSGLCNGKKFCGIGVLRCVRFQPHLASRWGGGGRGTKRLWSAGWLNTYPYSPFLPKTPRLPQPREGTKQCVLTYILGETFCTLQLGLNFGSYWLPSWECPFMHTPNVNHAHPKSQKGSDW